MYLFLPIYFSFFTFPIVLSESMQRNIFYPLIEKPWNLKLQEQPNSLIVHSQLWSYQKKNFWYLLSCNSISGVGSLHKKKLIPRFLTCKYLNISSSVIRLFVEIISFHKIGFFQHMSPLKKYEVKELCFVLRICCCKRLEKMTQILMHLVLEDWWKTGYLAN